MIDISVQHLKKAYEEGKDILKDLTFNIQEGEHVGILGQNGCGKTTLLRLLTGVISEDEGEIVIAKGKRIGLISQIPVYPEEYTTEDVLKTAHRQVYAIAKKLEATALKLENSSSKELLNEYDRLSADYERLGGFQTEYERNRVANGLDIPSGMRERLFSELSGGEKTRVNLARLILEDTDILLLDEPTNHLDLHATEWLEDYVLHFKGTVLAISHDRWFLDTVAQRCIEIVDGKADFYSGNYSFFVEEKQRRFDEQMRQYERDQAKIAQLTQAAEQMHLWAFMGNDKLHKRAFSMEKRIERLQAMEKPSVQKKLTAGFSAKAFTGDEVFLMDGVKKSFGNRVLFSDLNMLIEGRERIALIGDNGSGKSTLIKIMMGEEMPDCGFMRRGPSVKTAYLPQIIKFEHPERTLLDTMLYEQNCSAQEARDRLARFHFAGEDVFKTVSALSGGELARLRLCILMKHDINFLILDEPTNHLDIASREWIESAVEEYDQALLFVSHDRWFVEKFATRIWELKDGEITDYKGTFKQFREYKSRQEALHIPEQKSTPDKKEKKSKGSSGKSSAKSLERAEKEIERLENLISELTEEENANASDYVKLLELSEKKSELESQLEEAYARWEELEGQI